MEDLKISHSRLERYLLCPTSYKHHYINKWRPEVKKASLFFGSAVDKALNELLEGKGLDLAYIAYFLELEAAQVKQDPLVVYSDKDLVVDLLQTDDITELARYATELEVGVPGSSPHSLLESIKDRKADVGFMGLKETTRKFYNYANYLCILRKGIMILETYNREIMPQLVEVIKVQDSFEWNGIVGVIDFIAKTKDGKVVVFDNKTSYWHYPHDAVQNSTQLALYMQYVSENYKLDITHAGFVVMYKAPKKSVSKVCNKCGAESQGRHKTCDAIIGGERCHGEWTETNTYSINIDIILGTISPGFRKLVLDNYSDVRHSIKQEAFPKNLKTCSNVFGGPCEFYSLCHNNNTSGLRKESNEQSK